jgi:gentisate 1,2-dioxygenase
VHVRARTHSDEYSAANNGLQKRVLNPTLMKRTARQMAEESAARVRHNQRESGRTVQSTQALVQLILPTLAGPLGDYSPDVVFRALRGKGYYAVHGRTTAWPHQGAWFVTGETRYNGPHQREEAGTAHSVAVRDGWWLDSERTPLRLRKGEPLPSYFRLWAVYRLTMQKPPPSDTDDDETVDLTND